MPKRRQNASEAAAEVLGSRGRGKKRVEGPAANQDGDLVSIGGLTASKIGLACDENMPRHYWESVGRDLANAQAALNWIIGDWLRFGEKKWGVMYTEAAELTGMEEKSLRNIKYVSAAYPDISSRFAGLPWTHHRTVAGHPDRLKLLAQAERDGLSKVQLATLAGGGSTGAFTIEAPPALRQWKDWQGMDSSTQDRVLRAVALLDTVGLPTSLRTLQAGARKKTNGKKT